MDLRKKARGAGLGIALALLLGGLEAAAADKKAAATAPQAAATDTKPVGEDTKAPAKRTPKARSGDSAAPLLERAETPEGKAKRLRYAQAMKASRAASAKMDAAYVKAVAEREKARQQAEKAGKTAQDVPAEGDRAK